MAPTKKDTEKAGEKEARLTPDQSTALMLDYLRKQNRPYSATDISANLKNRVTKAAAAKLLKEMHERNEIEGRAAGKQIVYHAIQDEAEEVPADELAAIEAETARLKDETLALKTEEKDLRLALREGATQVFLPELRNNVSELEAKKTELSTRLAGLKAGSFKPVSLEERERAEGFARKMERDCKARLKIRNELWAEIASHFEKEKAEEVKEELGLEF